MIAQVVYRSGGPHKVFDQELAAGSIDVPVLLLELGRLGVTQSLTRSYQQLRILLDRGEVRLVIDGTTFKGTAGADDAVEASSAVELVRNGFTRVAVDL